VLAFSSIAKFAVALMTVFYYLVIAFYLISVDNRIVN